jgi:hypothetical protein
LGEDWAVLPQLVIEVLVTRSSQKMKGVNIYLIRVVLQGNKNAAIVVGVLNHMTTILFLFGVILVNKEAMDSDVLHCSVFNNLVHDNSRDLRFIRLY